MWPSAPGPLSLLFFRSLLSPGFSSCCLPLQSLLSRKETLRFCLFQEAVFSAPSPSSKQDQTHFSVIVLCSPRVTQKLLTSRGQLLHDSHVAMATLGIWYGLNTEIPVKGFESIHPKQSAMYWDLTRGCCQLIVIRGRFLEGPLEPRSQILKINLSYPPPEQLREPCQMLSGTSPT